MIIILLSHTAGNAEKLQMHENYGKMKHNRKYSNENITSQQHTGVHHVCSDLNFLKITIHLLLITCIIILNHAHKQKPKGTYAIALISEKVTAGNRWWFKNSSLESPVICLEVPNYFILLLNSVIISKLNGASKSQA